MKKATDYGSFPPCIDSNPDESAQARLGCQGCEYRDLCILPTERPNVIIAAALVAAFGIIFGIVSGLLIVFYLGSAAQ